MPHLMRAELDGGARVSKKTNVNVASSSTRKDVTARIENFVAVGGAGTIGNEHC